MDELNQFLNNVEASARKILKQQNKKQQELIARDRVALARGNKHATAVSPAKGSNNVENAVSRDELRASYGSGGSLIIQAPSPYPNSPSGGCRSEHASEAFGADDALPRINPLASNGNGPLRGSASTGSFLPAIEKKQHKDAAALEAAKKANRERRAHSSSVKIFDSPLYKSLAKVKSEQGFGNNSSNSSSSSPQSIKKAIHDVDNVNILLKKMGLRESSSSPSRRPDHAVEHRMCNACWARPTKLTGCEHHNRILPSNSSSDDQDPASIIRSLELQGPKSWLSDDLFIKYRSESDREALWDAFVQLKEQEKREQEALVQTGSSSFDSQQQQRKVIPIVTRHPVYHKFFTQIELENLKTQAETRRRNQQKAFIFDVNHIWLTNLDHFNDHLLMRQRRQQQRQLRRAEEEGGEPDGQEEASSDDDDASESNSLSDRRDETAICQGFSQIQSISSSRALQNAHFPEFDPSQSSFTTNRRQASLASNLAGTTNAQQSSRANYNKAKKRVKPRVYPMSLLVCGKWQPPPHGDATLDPLDLVPGLTLTGSKRVLWWRYLHEEIENDGTVELTKVVAMYARDAKLSSSNAILVSVVLALDAPMLSQLWFAWHVGSRAPPPPPPMIETDLLISCRRVSPCIWSLVRTPLQSRIDSLLPCTMVLLNDVAQSDDHTLSLDDPFGHRRFWPMTNKDAFRQWWLVKDSLPPAFDVTPRECSVQIAQPNAAGVCGRFCWHSTDAASHWICRRRVEKDYVYIVHNDRPSGSNDPMYFAVSMAHEVMLHVHAAKLAAYLAMLDERRRKRDYEAKLLEIEQKLEVGRLVLEAKRQEQKRIEQELEAAAVLKRAKSASARAKMKKLMPNSDAGSLSETEAASVLQEWDARLQQSVVTDEQGDWQQREITADDALVVFYHSLNQHLPLIHRFAWERPDTWQERLPDASSDKDDDNKNLTSRSDSSGDFDEEGDDDGAGDAVDSEQQENDEAMARITRVLLEDEQFLAILKEKLGLGALEATLSEQALANKLQKKNRRRSSVHDDSKQDDEALQVDWDDQMTMLTEESDVARASLMATKMTKLQLMPHEMHTSPLNPSAGEGWKRLKNSKLPKNFARSVYLAHTEGPRSAFLNQPNSATPVGMIDPAESSAYDAPEFFLELRALFVPKANADLQEKKLIWAEYERTKPRGPDMVHANNNGSGQPSGTALDALLEKDPAEVQMTVEDLVNKAILCARNNNLEGVSELLHLYVNGRFSDCVSLCE